MICLECYKIFIDAREKSNDFLSNQLDLQTEALESLNEEIISDKFSKN